MTRQVLGITLDNLDALPSTCRRCVYWELSPLQCTRTEEASRQAQEKESWVSAVLLEWGSCGTIVFVDGVPAGYALYAPAAYVPRSLAFPTSPVSADAVLLMTAYVSPAYGGQGLGRLLVQSVAKDVLRRGIRALEAFGAASGPAAKAGAGEPGSCLVPAEYLLAVGFKTVRPHDRIPRLRLELRNVLTWREDVEGALERLLGSMVPEPALRPI